MESPRLVSSWRTPARYKDSVTTSASITSQIKSVITQVTRLQKNSACIEGGSRDLWGLVLHERYFELTDPYKESPQQSAEANPWSLTSAGGKSSLLCEGKLAAQDRAVNMPFVRLSRCVRARQASKWEDFPHHRVFKPASVRDQH